MQWTWGDKDANVLAELEQRITQAGRNGRSITYSDLARGIDKHPPHMAGKAHRICVDEWTSFDSRMIGGLLGYISARSYCAKGFMASTLLVCKTEAIPSSSFF